MLTEYNKDY